MSAMTETADATEGNAEGVVTGTADQKQMGHLQSSLHSTGQPKINT